MRKFIFRHKLLLSINIIFVIIISAIQALQALLFQTIVDAAVGINNHEISSLIIYSVSFLIAVFLSETFSKTCSAALNKEIMKDYKQSIIENYINFDNQSKLTSSELISVLNNDVKMIEDSYIKSILNICKDIILFIISLFLLLSINIYLTIAIFILGWIPVILPQLFTKKSQLLKGKHIENLEKFVNQIKEVAQGFEVIKGFNIEEKIIAMATNINNEVEQSKFKSDAFNGFQGAISLVSGFAIFFVNLIIASYFVLRGDITVGAMIAAVQLMNYIVNPLISISMYVTKIKSVTKVIEKIEQKIINKRQETWQGNEEFYFNNAIKIDDLSYSYNNREKVISNLNIELKKGKKYAIVGESGCGKTTLLKILMNQITDYSGYIKIDEKSINSFNPKSYYQNVTLIQQNVFMFKDTLKNNICLYSECSEDKLLNAIHQSGLSKTINSHKDGLNTVVGEGKVELSGGELKRIAIARAIIKDANILLVDEATSALDKVMASEIEKTLINIDATVIAVTHQIDEYTLSKYDEILVMKDGKIVETGNFNQLVDNKGYFYYLYNNGRDFEKLSEIEL